MLCSHNNPHGKSGLTSRDQVQGAYRAPIHTILAMQNLENVLLIMCTSYKYLLCTVIWWMIGDVLEITLAFGPMIQSA